MKTPVSELKLLLDTGDGLSQFLLALNVTLTADHDTLGLGRTGSVEGLGTIAHCGSTQTYTFQEAHDLLEVLCGDPLSACEILVADVTYGFTVLVDHCVGVEIGLGGHGDHQTAGNIRMT